MRKSRVLKPFAVAAGISVLAFPAFAHSAGGRDRAGSFQATAAAQPVEPEPPQLPGSGEMETTDRTGTTEPSGSRAFSKWGSGCHRTDGQTGWRLCGRGYRPGPRRTHPHRGRGRFRAGTISG